MSSCPTCSSRLIRLGAPLGLDWDVFEPPPLPAPTAMPTTSAAKARAAMATRRRRAAGSRERRRLPSPVRLRGRGPLALGAQPGLFAAMLQLGEAEPVHRSEC